MPWQHLGWLLACFSAGWPCSIVVPCSSDSFASSSVLALGSSAAVASSSFAVAEPELDASVVAGLGAFAAIAAASVDLGSSFVEVERTVIGCFVAYYK